MPAAKPARGSILDPYLSVIGEVPLLSAEEERDLAGHIARGDAAARNHLVRANLRLVVKVARQFLGRGLPLEDLVADGNLGLIRAADGFDPSAGCRFTTYACLWIKQAIRRSLTNTGRPIRLPCHVVQMLSKWRRAAGELERALGRTPTHEEIGDSLELSPRQKADMEQSLRLLEILGRCNEAWPGEDGGVLKVIADERTLGAEEQVIAAEDVAGLHARLGVLSNRESEILRLRFGLGACERRTLAEVGRAVGGCTPERVRQIETRALAKLRETADRTRPRTPVARVGRRAPRPAAGASAKDLGIHAVESRSS
ncbi:sigma-70 family RNA polymerase sigma factor [Paludisphaera mucosa]|uniref:RNA polymerase sigma factor RpoD/SigA n=1 Tax=Paludisphaera mucosa TaxID=3030827 RepID=A0ABT6FEN9_9BACT|nr:RNA polymerase sigma factor RpoD/SigA [Paludisphaera mucosa]MDG3006036.1 RNA polymerase sigma factor RpoD/SigA [Paludisphaera mucosa]